MVDPVEVPAVRPSPSAGDVSLRAVALDRRVDDLDAAAERLSLPRLRRTATSVLLGLTGGRRLHLFRVGAVVVEGALDQELCQGIESATGAILLTSCSERFDVAVDPAQPAGHPRVGWDRVVIPEPADPLVGAVATLLGQSAALERYEAAADALVAEALELARLLAGRRLPRSTRRLVERVGRVLRDRLELAQQFYLFDRPDETWEDARVAELYDALFANLELSDRHRAMLHKLEAVESSTETTLGLWQGRRSNALEWAIIVLIAVEIALALAGLM